MPAASTTTRPKPRWPISVAVLLGLGASFGGLNRAFTDTSWWFVAVGVATLVTVSIMGMRSLVRFRWLPPLVGFAVLVVAMTFSFAPGLGYLGFIPNADSIAAFGQLITAGSASIASQAIPADPTGGIVFMLTAGAGLLAIALDFTAQIAQRPALVGIPFFVVLLIPTFFVGGAGNPLAFVFTTGAYLLVLYLDLGEVRAGGAVGVGATAVAAALVLPLVLPPIAAPEPPSNGSGFAVGINTFITLGENLRRPNVTEVLTYANDGDDPEYLAVAVIEDFTGTKWSPAPPTVNEGNLLIDFKAVPGLGAGIPVETQTTAVNIVNMGGHWVPAPYAPSSITELDGNWTYDSQTFSVSSPNLSIRGEQYVVESTRATPTLDQLRAAPADYPASLDGYLQVPDGLPAVVAETAAAVVADQTSSFDQAAALQAFFHDGDFVYSETAPVEQGYDGSSAEIVGRFLEEKSGYCVHFSSAMAVMARTLGIPSRIVVGFTPGDYQRATDQVPAHYSVTTSNLHAWPELWFGGIGWVRFEPTPGRGFEPSFESESQTGPSTSPNSGPTAAPTLAPRPTSTPTPTATAEQQQAGPAGPADQTVARLVVTIVVVAALVVALLPLVPVAVRAWRRRRRYWAVRRRGSAVDAWAELRDTATDLGRDTATLTPREFAMASRARMPEAVLRALANLLTALEVTAYSPTPAPSLLRDLRVVRRHILRSASRTERVRAALTPASVQLRMRLPGRR